MKTESLPAISDSERIAKLAARAEAALAVARQFNRSALAEWNEVLLASQLNELLQDLDVRILRRLVRQKPESFLRLAALVNSQSAERTRREKLELDFQKYRDEVAEKKQRILDATSGGLTPEVLARIQEAANLL